MKRRIAPFILRRQKEDVLKELPPKVIQDYQCNMTSIQEHAYHIVERDFPWQASVTKVKQKTSGLANLIIHRKACNHPLLIKNTLKQNLLEKFRGNLSHYENSGKLIGLVEILQDCEIMKMDKVEYEESKTAAIDTSLADFVA